MGNVPSTARTALDLPVLPSPVSLFDKLVAAGIPRRSSDRLNVAIIQSGVGRVIGEFGAIQVTRGDLVLIPPFLDYHCVVTSPGRVIGGAFDLGFVSDQVRWTVQGRPDRGAALVRMKSLIPSVRALRPTMSQRHQLEARVVALLRTRGPAVAQRVLGAAELIWMVGVLIDPVASATVLQDESQPIPLRSEVRKVIDLLHEQLDADWRIADLAAAVALSESALLRAFHRELGLSPQEYLHLIRRAKFEQLVAETDVGIAEASRLVGWHSTSHPRKVFRDAHGHSPQEHRESRDDATRLQLPDVWGL